MGHTTQPPGSPPAHTVAIAGDPTARLSTVATHVAAVITRSCVPAHTIALAGLPVLDPSDDAVHTAIEEVRRASLLIVLTPVVHAGVSGLLKGFLDQIPARGLRSVTAVPVVVGDPSHHLSVEASLRSTLLDLGVVSALPAIGLAAADLRALGTSADPVVPWRDRYVAPLPRALTRALDHSATAA